MEKKKKWDKKYKNIHRIILKILEPFIKIYKVAAGAGGRGLLIRGILKASGLLSLSVSQNLGFLLGVWRKEGWAEKNKKQ